MASDTHHIIRAAKQLFRANAVLGSKEWHSQVCKMWKSDKFVFTTRANLLCVEYQDNTDLFFLCEPWTRGSSSLNVGVATLISTRSTLLQIAIWASDSKVVTCAAVWRMPKELESGSHESPDDSSSNAQTLELLCHLDNTAHGNMACVMWEPMGDGKRLISLADNNILLWDLQESSAKAVLSSSTALEGKGQLKFTSGRWSPHHNCTQIATASDTTVRGWDTRSMRQIYCIENTHGQLVRDLDFNPNKQYYLASCGDDCKVKFWDTRNVTEPVKTLEEHSHWVWNVRYNHSHDQLILTGSSDSRVILSNMVSISSEPFGHMVDDDDLSDQEDHHQEEKSKEPLQDSIIATYEEHEDSVYAVEWSSADPWLFASLSYDGRLVINRVPRALKYHILL
uniref:EARP complex and GARP complex interacting protein 1 n=1 Tax=Apteryx owenii TaxID=8824 RepID=A0A8B9PVZ3_APTOW